MLIFFFLFYFSFSLFLFLYSFSFLRYSFFFFSFFLYSLLCFRFVRKDILETLYGSQGMVGCIVPCQYEFRRHFAFRIWLKNTIFDLLSGQEKHMGKSLPCYRHDWVLLKEALAKGVFGNTAVCERYKSTGLMS